MANPLKMLKLKQQGIQVITEAPVSAAPKKVWATIKNSASWFYFDPATKGKHNFDLKVGGNWIMTSPNGYTTHMGTVVHIEPGKLIRVYGQLGLTHLPVIGVLIFELQPQNDGKTTLLRVGLRLSGFMDSDVKKRYSGAWEMLAGQLKTVAEK